MNTGGGKRGWGVRGEGVSLPVDNVDNFRLWITSRVERVRGMIRIAEVERVGAPVAPG